MKLIRGRTLAALLAERASPAADLPRFLQVFEVVRQAVGYAHSKGFIHRDLKPANVMVGAFGEVQVMNLGLAKVLTPFSREAESAEPSGGPLPQSVIDTGRDAADATQAGSVLGTPVYMPPEQANRELDEVDRRADVFALGAILCEVLTGRPPYTGTFAQVRAQATLGLTGPALERLTGCRVVHEWVVQCRSCLQADPADRPPDAAVMATRAVAPRTLLGQEGQARATDRARAVENKRRRLTVLCALSLAADPQEDDAAADKWLNAVAVMTEAPELIIHNFSTPLDAFGRPDLAHRVAARGLGRLTERPPPFGSSTAAAWYACGGRLG